MTERIERSEGDVTDLDARAEFDARLMSSTSRFQKVNVPVTVTGVGFFDRIHGQTGAAPNGIELHPVDDIQFQ